MANRTGKSTRGRKTRSQVFHGLVQFLFSLRLAFRNVCAMASLPEELILQHVPAALAEDIGSGDVTTLATVPEERMARAAMIAREELVVCGLPLARAAFAQTPAMRFQDLLRDGARAE